MTDITSKGAAETAILRANINDQLNRLLTQLEDLDELKDEFSIEEFNEIKSETIQQLSDFQTYLSMTLKGDLTLVDEFGAAQLALQSAISSAFHTPEVIRLFAQRQPQAIRDRFNALRRDFTLNKLSEQSFLNQSLEMLNALQSMGEKLTPEEQAIMDRCSSTAQFETINDENQSIDENALMNQAKQQISKTQR